MTNRRKFISTILGASLATPLMSGSPTLSENPYDSILPELMHTQYATPGDNISIICKNWHNYSDIDGISNVFGAKIYHGPMAHLSIHSEPTYPDSFHKGNAYDDDKRIIESLLLNSSKGIATWKSLDKDIIVNANRILCRNRRGAGDIMVCNPTNYEYLKDLHPTQFKVISSEFIPTDKILMLYKGSVVWDGVGVIAVNKSDPRYRYHYLRAIEDYATTISIS